MKIFDITKGRHLSRGGYNRIFIKFGGGGGGGGGGCCCYCNCNCCGDCNGTAAKKTVGTSDHR